MTGVQTCALPICIIEVTNRANLQIRGIGSTQAPAVAETLVGAGLGPDQPGGDDIRNVMVNPTAGIDTGQIIDTRPLARALLDRVQADDTCCSLSPKFSFLIDGGEDIAVVDHPHDIWLSSLDPEWMAIGFAGCPPATTGDTPAAGIIRTDKAVDTVMAAVTVFKDMMDDPAITRLRHLFASHSREAFLRRLGLRSHADGWRRRATQSRAVRRGRQRDGLAYVGATPPLGRLTPTMLVGAAEMAARYGADELRLTPWQSLLVPHLRKSEVTAVTGSLERLGFVCDAEAPLASMIACAGSPGCSAGLSDAKADALVLAETLPHTGRAVHVSGCAKSCASPAVADITLVGVGPGVYDVYANNLEAGAGRFGRQIA